MTMTQKPRLRRPRIPMPAPIRLRNRLQSAAASLTKIAPRGPPYPQLNAAVGERVAAISLARQYFPEETKAFHSLRIPGTIIWSRTAPAPPRAINHPPEQVCAQHNCHDLYRISPRTFHINNRKNREPDVKQCHQKSRDRGGAQPQSGT